MAHSQDFQAQTRRCFNLMFSLFFYCVFILGATLIILKYITHMEPGVSMPDIQVFLPWLIIASMTIFARWCVCCLSTITCLKCCFSEECVTCSENCLRQSDIKLESIV